jgi:hypothetical protein
MPGAKKLLHGQEFVIVDMLCSPNPLPLGRHEWMAVMIKKASLKPQIHIYYIVGLSLPTPHQQNLRNPVLDRPRF